MVTSALQLNFPSGLASSQVPFNFKTSVSEIYNLFLNYLSIFEHKNSQLITSIIFNFLPSDLNLIQAIPFLALKSSPLQKRHSFLYKEYQIKTSSPSEVLWFRWKQKWKFYVIITLYWKRSLTLYTGRRLTFSTKLYDPLKFLSFHAFHIWWEWPTTLTLTDLSINDRSARDFIYFDCPRLLDQE